MVVATGVQTQIHGLPPRPVPVDEVLEYRKIIEIRNQVEAGTHPRLRPHNISRSQPISHAAGQPTAGTQESSVNGPQEYALPPSKLIKDPPLGIPSSNVVAKLPVGPARPSETSVAPQSLSFKNRSTELDPIFLTKSDDLVRAELQLQRQRIERVLREQFDQKKFDVRHKPSPAEAKSDFDVADVLAKALNLVQPIALESSPTPPPKGSNTDSLDENSFYSSKAPDSIPHEEDDLPQSSVIKHHARSVQVPSHAADRVADRHHADWPDSQRKGLFPQPRGSPHMSATDQAPRDEAPLPRSKEDTMPVQAAITVGDDDDEPEYSPPEPAQPVLHRRVTTHLAHGPRDRPWGNNDTYTSYRQRAYRDKSPPDRGVQVVSSHIKSPAAPQPSRVSPLALAEHSSTTQARQGGVEVTRPRRLAMADRSSDATPLSNQPRKKRKLRSEKQPGRQRVANSPDVVIKDEPVSPPPFHNVPPLGTVKHRPSANRPVYIDLEPTRDAFYPPEAVSAPSPVQLSSGVNGSTSHHFPRVSSTRAMVRDAPRSGQDLRRVATMQNLPPRDYVDASRPAATQKPRAPSRALRYEPANFRTEDERPVFYEPPRPTIQSPRLFSAYQDTNFERATGDQSPVARAPRRVLVDRYGQHVYPEAHSPPVPVDYAYDRRQETNGYIERPRARTSLPAHGRLLDAPPSEPPYVQELPPPRTSHGIPVEDPTPATPLYRYATNDSPPAQPKVRYFADSPHVSQIPESQSTRIQGHPRYEPVYLDDAPAPSNATVPRSNTRPIARVYQEPQEMVHRAPSVTARSRGMRLYRDETVREYGQPAPVERPLYEVRHSHDGAAYYQLDDGQEMVMERSVDHRPAYATRY